MTNTKKQYLKQLKRTLYWRLPQGEMGEVLADYEGFFDEGTRTGRSEAELCAQFGPPKKVARDLIREECYSGKPLGLLAVAVFVLTVLLTNVTIPGIAFPFGEVFLWDLHFDFPDSAWLSALLIPLLWFFWRNLPSAPLSKREKRGPSRLCVIALLLWLVSWIPAVLFSVCREKTMTDGPNPFRFALYEVLWSVETALAVLLLLSLLGAWRKSLWYLLPAACCQGFMAGIDRYTGQFMFISPLQSPSPLPLLGGLFSAALCTALVVWLIRHGPALRETIQTKYGNLRDLRFALLFWPCLTLWLTRTGYFLFDWSQFTPFVAAPLLLPLLRLLWRDNLKHSPLSGKERRDAALLLVLPFLLWLVPTVLVLSLLDTLYTPWWRPDLGISLGAFIRFLYTAVRWITACAMLISLAKGLLHSSAFLLPAAHCVGIMAAISSGMQWFGCLDPSVLSYPYVAVYAFLIFIPYALGWLGAGIVFLIQKWEGRHERTA